MKTRLTIKHLAPYLPYGLKVCSEEKLPFSPFFENKIEKHSYEMGVVSMMAILQNGDKPILRPLSDFNYSLGYPNKEMFYEDVKNKTITVKLMEELLEDHIDVFGLIEKGLAIDINELKL